MNINRFFTLTSGVLLVGLLFSSPALAQGGEGGSYSDSNLSDVTGPFLGNVTVPVPFGTSSVPRAVSVWIALPDLLTQSLVSQPVNTNQNTGQSTSATVALVNSALNFNHSMDKLMPFCGCANPRWRTYNHTIKAADQLRVSLGNAVAEQRQMLTANPTPAQVDAAQKRLKALEDTTSALEKATEVLTALSQALDKAR